MLSTRQRGRGALASSPGLEARPWRRRLHAIRWLALGLGWAPSEHDARSTVLPSARDLVGSRACGRASALLGKVHEAASPLCCPVMRLSSERTQLPPARLVQKREQGYVPRTAHGGR